MKLISTNLKFNLLLLILFWSISIMAQENYQPGYIINNQTDTIHGYINYQNWGKNPLNINFKSEVTEPFKILSSKEIRGFGVNDEIYESANIQNDISITRTTMIPSDGNLQLDTINGFIEILINGPKVLGTYKNSLGKKSYYIKRDSIFELLIYKQYVTTQVDEQKIEHSVMTENKRYLNQLSTYFTDCPGIEFYLKKTSYNQTDLENIFETYFNLTHTTHTYKKKREKTTVVFGILGGITLSTVKFTNDDDLFAYLTQTEFNRSDNFVAGITLDLIFPRGNKKWSIYSELLYSSMIFRSEYLQITNASNSTLHHVEIGGTYIKLNNLIRYRFFTGKNTLFFNAGISNGIAVKVINNDYQTIQYYTTITNESKEAIEGFRKHEQSLILGIGYQFDKFSLEYKFEKTNGMTTYADLGSSVIRNYFTVNYSF